MFDRLGLDAEVVKAVALRQLRRDQQASGEGHLPQGRGSSSSSGSSSDAAADAAGPAKREPAAAAAGGKAAGQRRGGRAAKGDGKALAQFCRDLCAEARSGRLDPVSTSNISGSSSKQLQLHKTLDGHGHVVSLECMAC